jgi:hypothetical protein
MNLQQISNTTMTSNTETTSVVQRHNIKKPNTSNDNVSVAVVVNENNIDKKDSLSANINGYINDISNFSVILKQLNQQLDILDKIKDATLPLKKGVSSQSEAQPTITQFISQYDASTESIKEQMANLKDLEGDSTTYFDGMAGAIPIDIDELEKEIKENQIRVSDTITKINQLNDISKNYVKQTISKEIENAQQKSPFKEMNFGQESAHFTSQNITSIMGSIVSVQANASQMQNIRLLS